MFSINLKSIFYALQLLKVPIFRPNFVWRKLGPPPAPQPDLLSAPPQRYKYLQPLDNFSTINKQYWNQVDIFVLLKNLYKI